MSTTLSMALKRGTAFSLIMNYIEWKGSIDEKTNEEIKSAVDMMINRGDLLLSDWNLISKRIESVNAPISSSVLKKELSDAFKTCTVQNMFNTMLVGNKPLTEVIATESLTNISNELNVPKEYVNIVALFKCIEDAKNQLNKHLEELSGDFDTHMKSAVNLYGKHFDSKYLTAVNALTK